jgi:hypothetical protein
MADRGKSYLDRLAEREQAANEERAAKERAVNGQSITSDTGIRDQLGEAVRAAPGIAESLVTGKGQIEPKDMRVRELPDFEATQPFKDIVSGVEYPGADAVPYGDQIAPNQKSGNLLAFGKSDAGKLGILKRMVPGIDHKSDDAGNIIVNINEEQAFLMRIRPGRYFINRPGISGQDIDDIVNSATIELFTSAAGASLGQKVLVNIGKALGISGGLSAGSIVQDLISGSVGSDQGVDSVSASVAGLFGIGGTALAALGNKLIPGIKSILRTPINFDESGKVLNARGRRALKNMGVEDPSNIGPEVVAEFDDLITTRNPSAKQVQEATAAAEAVTLPVPVTQRRGDLGADAALQSAEENAASGVLGPELRGQAQGIRETQSTQMAANRAGIQERITGRESNDLVTDSGQGLAKVQGRLRANMAEANRGVNEAFAVARAGRSLRFEKQPLENFSAKLRITLRKKFLGSLKEDSPALRALDFLEGGDVLGRTSKIGRRIPTVGIRELEGFTTNINALMRGVNDPVDRKALGMVRKAYENAIDQMINTSLVKGDIRTLRKYRNARFLRKRMAKKFESNRIVSDLIDVTEQIDDLGREVVDLRMNPTEAINYLFSANGIGSKKGVSQALRKIKSLLGADSSEWKAMQEEAVLRIFEPATAVRGGIRFESDIGKVHFSGQKFNTSLAKAMKDAPEVMNDLFSKRDLNLLHQFARVSMRTTAPVKGTINTSNSFVAFARFLSEQQGATGAILKKLIGFIPKNADENMARKALAPQTSAVVQRRIGGGRVGGLIGVAATTLHGRRRRGPQLITK